MLSVRRPQKYRLYQRSNDEHTAKRTTRKPLPKAATGAVLCAGNEHCDSRPGEREACRGSRARLRRPMIHHLIQILLGVGALTYLGLVIADWRTKGKP